MRSFAYQRAEDASSATRAATPASAYLAGGTTLVDLMKLDVLRPARVIDINPLQGEYGAITAGPDGLRLGALARMADVAADSSVRRDYPVIAQALDLAASGQIRNMASLGGNVLQRTRCAYYRDVSWTACNKRDPGSGCAALDGVNRRHAVLGVSDACIAAYPGDLAQALVALETVVVIRGADGQRRMPFEDLHRPVSDGPHKETTLAPGELITGFHVPAGPWTRRSLYLKVRDRQSFEFALASAAVALELDASGMVREARIGLGGVAYRPWRAHAAEAVLKGETLDEASAKAAADAAFRDATPRAANAFKPELGRRTLVRALLAAKAIEV
jgi:xanthine dehydrogenase YagS FAD-binding subunit